MDMNASRLNVSDMHSFFEKLSGPSPLLISDYDGTLVSFRKDRMNAFISEKTKSLLKKIINSGGFITILSGRQSKEIDKFISLPVEIWGCHGWERRTADGDLTYFPVPEDIFNALDRFSAELGFFPSDALEIKPVSTAIHWRDRPDIMDLYRIHSNKILSMAEKYGLRMMPFNCGIEFIIPLFSKGVAVENIISAHPSLGPICYLGDDLTDEDAFLAIKKIKGAIGILISEKPRDSYANLWMAQDTVDCFLNFWHEFLSRGKRSANG